MNKTTNNKQRTEGAGVTRKGPLFVMLSAVLFSLSGLLIKYLPWSGISLNGARNLIALIVLFIFHKAVRHQMVYSKEVIFGAIALTATSTTFAIANKMTTAGNAIILQFAMPIFVMVFSVIFLHKKPTRLDLVIAVLVLGGVLCFFVDSLSAGNMAGNAIALLSGLTYAIVFLMNTAKNGDALSSVLLGAMLSAIVGLPFFFRENLVGLSGKTWLALLVLGVIQQAFAYICLSIGLNTTPPIMASLISGLEPVLNPILVAVFYGEMLSTLSLIGSVIVIVPVILYNVLSVHITEKSEPEV